MALITELDIYFETRNGRMTQMPNYRMRRVNRETPSQQVIHGKSQTDKCESKILDGKWPTQPT